MSEMVIRVAIAIHNAMEKDYPKFTRQDFEALTLVSKASMAARAIEAIKAMREPTEDMENAGYTSEAFRKGTQPGSLDYRPDYIWRAMIDEALK